MATPTLRAISFHAFSDVSQTSCYRRRMDKCSSDGLRIYMSEFLGNGPCLFQCSRIPCISNTSFESFSLLRVRAVSDSNRNGKPSSYSAKRRRFRQKTNEKSNWSNPWDDFSVDITQKSFKLQSLPEGSVKENVLDNEVSEVQNETVFKEDQNEPVKEKFDETKSESSTKKNDGETPPSASFKKKKPLSSLNSYFDKLNTSNAPPSAVSDPVKSESVEKENLFSENSSESFSTDSKANTTSEKTVQPSADSENVSKSEKALNRLNAYFDKISPPKPPVVKVEESESTINEKESKSEPSGQDKPKSIPTTMKDFKSQFPNSPNDDDLEFYFFDTWLRTEKTIIPFASYAVIALNVGIYLLELATPQAIPGELITSLPALFAAKVDSLILAGDWWRLITPSLLHSGFFHLAIGSLAMLSIGTPMEIVFGTAGFIGTYVAGGMFGNLLSFVQTPEVAVGGTGPIYALLGATMVFYLKNRKALGTEYADSEVRKLIFLGALNIFLGNPLPIDDWTHIGATLGGIFYGLLAAPKVTVVKIPSKGKSGTLSPASEQENEVKILFELPDNKQQFWIFALNMAIFVVLYDIATMAATGTLPDNVFDLMI